MPLPNFVNMPPPQQRGAFIIWLQSQLGTEYDKMTLFSDSKRVAVVCIKNDKKTLYSVCLTTYKIDEWKGTVQDDI